MTRKRQPPEKMTQPHVLHLEDEAAERLFHVSGFRDFIFSGWHVFYPHRAFCQGRYHGPFETREEAVEYLRNYPR